jgi:hypothetical protein
MKAYKDLLSQTTRLLCFSKQIRSPLLWGDYAEKHKGLVLEFDVNDELIKHVTYQKKQMKLEGSELREIKNATEKLLTTKYIDWKYEDEARIIFSIDDEEKSNNLVWSNDILFFKFNENFKLNCVILGALSPLHDSEIKNMIPDGRELKVRKVRMSLNEFHIVRDQTYGTNVLTNNKIH